MAWLCLGNIVYCGLVAMRQKNFNWLIGYSSVAHMGFVFLGIASLNLIGVTGAVLVMIAHGFLAALTFGLSGYLYQQTGTLEMEQLGGLLRRLPFVGAALIMAMFAGCGLPGFANFAGEITVFFGAWSKFNLVTRAGAVGRAGDWRGLHAARDPEHAARAAAGKMDGGGGINLAAAQAALSGAAGGLLVFGFFPSLLADKIKPAAEKIVKAMADPDGGRGRKRKRGDCGSEATRTQ